MSKVPHAASDAQDIKGANVFLTEESPAPPVMVGIARQHASKLVMSPVERELTSPRQVNAWSCGLVAQIYNKF